MYIIMLGAPGSGKGTIGRELVKKYDLKYLSTGDIFRDEIEKNTELGIEVNKYLSDGSLVPDEITIKIVEEKIKSMDKILLDGFPRTIKQAEKLDEFLNENGKSITAVINLNIPDKDVITRTSHRVICSNKDCGASFNTMFMPPKVDWVCDICGSKLIKRKDDKPETIKDRLVQYHKNTKPLIDYYEKEGVLETINIDIYSNTTKEDTTDMASKLIEKKLKK